VPAWLGELATVVTGFCAAESDEEESLTLDQIRTKTHRHEIEGPYAYVWLRVFGELPSSQKTKASLISTAPVEAPVAARVGLDRWRAGSAHPTVRGNLVGTARQDPIE
jgi:hypothetical protein